MDPQVITQIITTVGFPIVAAGALFWFIKDEIKSMRSTIEANTSILVELKELIRGLSK